MALSDLGTSKTGDTVTLLLGRSGGVAAVQTGSAASSSILIGVVTATGSSSYTDASGNSYSAPTVTFTATDGAQYTYQVSAGSSYAAGDLVQASTSSGAASVKRLSAATSLSGRVSADGSKLGTYTFASDVEILDTYADSSLRIYPSRLAGINLQSGVRYYLLNAKGEISRLILDDVTGDLHQYGVVTSSNEYSVDMSVGSAYVYDIGGVTGVYSSASSMLGASVGPARFRFKSGALASVNNLTQVKLSAVSGGTALAGSTTYTLSDTVAVYEVKNASYFPSSLDRVASGYSLVGWYDKAESAGGRIRVITAIALES
ncbi:hypothetical protein SDC9_120495 [bioreactor metagenome]|uniref:Uncharacterized protein n=1 Tax=bioreactor metagenome TaxID=1076179 RepID=A0A645C9R5_9ZZZZ